MKNWNEVRTAYQVAKLGTISAAAKRLDVHRATVIRHIDALEAELGNILFERSLSGYKPTAAGYDLLQVAELIEQQFSRLVLRTSREHSEIEGEFVITSLDIAAPLILPTLKLFKSLYPKVDLKYITSEALFKLEYGHAHFAIRSGARPEHEDYLVSHFCDVKIGLYADQTYIEKRGLLKSIKDISNHDFISFIDYNPKLVISRWLYEKVPDAQVVLRSNSRVLHHDAILSGIGIGFMIESEVQKYPNIKEVFKAEDDWVVSHWQLIHKDLQYSKKIEAFLNILNTAKVD